MTTATERTTIPVTGMTCAACSARIQRTLERAPGVASANVNLMTNSATVEFDPAVATLDGLVETIRETGYGAELPAPPPRPARRKPPRSGALGDERTTLRRKVVVSLVAAALAMLIGIPLGEAAAAQGVADPLMRFMMPLTDGLRAVVPGLFAVDAATWRWTLLVLTLPMVFWAGRHFYARAWAAARHGGADMNTLIAIGTGAAFLFSLAVTLGGPYFVARGVEPHVYYEAVIWIIALILLGNYLEARAKGRTSAAIRKLVALRPDTAHVVRGGEVIDLPLTEVRAGDVAVVAPRRGDPRGRRRARGHHVRGRVDAHRRADAGGEVGRASPVVGATLNRARRRPACATVRAGADTVLLADHASWCARPRAPSADPAARRPHRAVFVAGGARASRS